MGAGVHGGFGNTKGYKNTMLASGNAIFQSGDRTYFNYISKRKDIDANGIYDVVVHGASNFIVIQHNGKDINVNSRNVAKIIKKRTDYKRGQPIRLLSCDTGKGENSFAQNLANKLGVTVYAPTEMLWARPNGTHFIAAAMKNNLKVPDFSKKGHFKKFKPGGNK